ncbi:PadR family transcriptional regulator [Actinomadura sp. DC4]|uniref:PadR family transcriptional regulator n=1 Tax=Actinomadura sp. DC4 TaxID=3055069 RepID=UPI0025AF85BD|nr:PadR family transcriptional regulator [Actinomadura sp. DC4]MDN3351150.1 PadR family transcriptional regulator [Actinomadura sp. DC4]
MRPSVRHDSNRCSIAVTPSWTSPLPRAGFPVDVPCGVSEGTIYPLLSRLRRDGAIESFWRESDSGPPRRYYRLTEPGRQSLRTFRAEWDRFKNAVDQWTGESP